MEPAARESFGWHETEARLRAFLEEGAIEPAGHGFTLAGPDDRPLVTLILPLVLPAPVPEESAGDYLDRLPDTLGDQLVLLLQAGAAAIGWWRDDELLAHKVIKRYVVRGRGRAQPTHLKTRGKSRYGSRLRLQNHRRLLRKVNELIDGWWAIHGPADRVFTSVPVRTWPELRDAAPALPFDPGHATRIPLHVHVPDHRELLRVRAHITRGEVRRTEADLP